MSKTTRRLQKVVLHEAQPVYCDFVLHYRGAAPYKLFDLIESPVTDGWGTRHEFPRRVGLVAGVLSHERRGTTVYVVTHPARWYARREVRHG